MNIKREKPPISTNVDWHEAYKVAREQPGEWFRIEHEYSSDRSARNGVSEARVRYPDLQIMATTKSRQSDGGLGIFVQFPKEKG